MTHERDPARHETTGPDTTEPDTTEPDPAEHDAVESARPSVGCRDQPDALRPDAEDRPHRTLPPDEPAAD